MFIVKSFGLTLRTYAVFIFLLLLFFISCKKDPDKIGIDIQPPEDRLKVKFSDTSSIVAYSVIVDSVLTNGLSVNLVGSSYDLVFGKTVASFATQILLSKAGIDFGENPKLDSLILSMVYVGYYGDTNTLQTFSVYELSEDIFVDSNYYSNKRVQHSDIDLAHYSFYPRPNDSLVVDETTEAPQLKINLNAITPALGDKILNAPEDVLADNNQFIDYIKGIYITSQPVNYGGAILYFNMLSATSLLTLYYSNDSLDGLSYDLYINGEGAMFNEYEHFNYDHASQELRKQIVYNDTTLGNEFIYLQAMSGIKTLLRIPNLLNYTSSTNIGINEASLYFYNFDTESEYSPPLEIYLARIDEDGDLVLLTDYYEGTDYFGGGYDDEKGVYKFRITRFIQEVLNGEITDPLLSLSITGASSIGNRIVINGSDSPFNNIRLEIIYTEVN